MRWNQQPISVKNSSYFHRNCAMVKGYRHSQYRTMCGVKTTWLDSSDNGLNTGGRVPLSHGNRRHCISFNFFSTKPRDWLERTSPKRSILFQVGRKTLMNIPFHSILICCSSLNLPPLNPGVTNFQGHSFKILLTHRLPSIIYVPLHVIRLSCLGSERPHGLHVLSHAPKNIAPLLTTP